MAVGPMVPLTTVPNAAVARILAAHLGAEGIVWELRGGGTDGPYPVGPVDILVAESDLEAARALVADTPNASPQAGGSDRAPAELWLLLVVILLVAGFLVARILGGS